MQIRSAQMTNLPTRRPTVEEKRGATIIVDSFEGRSQHGVMVEGAAQSLGSAGSTVRYEQTEIKNGKASMPHLDSFSEFQSSMAFAPLSKEQARTALEEFVTSATVGTLNKAAAQVERARAEGFTQSVVNISQGLDSLALLQLVKYPMGERSKLAPANRALYEENLDVAIGFQPSSTDAKRTAVERDNAALQAVKAYMKESPAILASREEWNTKVQEFESGHNSVVVAAGNSGQHIRLLAKLGFELDGSEDHNVLSVAEVTTVGAARQVEGGFGLDPSSSFGDEVDILADGQFQHLFGTSFASPKVANAMRKAHLEHPDFESDQAEEFVRSELSFAGQVADKPLAVLDPRRADIFLSF